MGNSEDLKQKMKGKFQQGKGEYHKKTGDDVKGIVEKVKGKFNEEVADFKMDTQNKKNKDT